MQSLPILKKRLCNTLYTLLFARHYVKVRVSFFLRIELEPHAYFCRYILPIFVLVFIVHNKRP